MISSSHTYIRRIIPALLLLIASACSKQLNPVETPPYDLTAKEMMAANRRSELGDPVRVISFAVNTQNREIYEDGIIPSVNIEDPHEDLPRLILKDQVLFTETTVTVLIDYPLNNPYRFTVTSENGITRALLLQEISKHYALVYAEEERTATVKTLPLEEREMINRNETNGIYGIWGHDLGDLFLTDIQVHKSPDGNVVLVLVIES